MPLRANNHHHATADLLLMTSKPTTPSDGELLRRMAAGDDRAFTALYRRHQGAIYRFALLMSGSTAIAEDVTQEAFMVLIREAHLYDPSRGTLTAYLYGIARNYVRRRLKRDSFFVSLIHEAEDGEEIPPAGLIADDDPFSNFSRNEMTRLVRQAVLALPSRYRETVVLCDFQELTYAEAAQALGCAVGTVSSRLHRGHALLFERLRAVSKLDPATPDDQLLRCFT